MAVGIHDQENLHAGFFAGADAIPLLLGRHEQRVAGVVQGSEDRIEALHADLEVDPTPKWRLQRRRDPVPAYAALLEHEVRAPTRDVGEALFGTLILDVEPAETAPKRDARLSVADEQFGGESGIHGR